jgi:alpha-beta hydrolase superfamily lysophospholipase
MAQLEFPARTIQGETEARPKSTTSHGVQSMNYHLSSVVDRSPISVRQWLPPPEVVTKAVVQLTHGISEHSGRYDRFGRYLAEHGYRVYASDLRGHGLSVPQSALGKAGIHFWADTTADMKQLLDIMQTENPQLSRFAFGHSLGSALTQSHIQNWGVMFKGAILCGTFGAFPGMSDSQLRETTEAIKPLAFSPDTSDEISRVFTDLLELLNRVSGPDFKGCDWQTSDETEIERFLRDPLNGKPFCNRMMYGVLLGLLQLWKPENERRIPKDLPIFVMGGTRDPVGGMTTTVQALIDRYQKNGVRDLSHVFYDGVRHEPMNDFSRDQFHADVVTWLDQHLPHN